MQVIKKPKVSPLPKISKKIKAAIGTTKIDTEKNNITYKPLCGEELSLIARDNSSVNDKS